MVLLATILDRGGTTAGLRRPVSSPGRFTPARLKGGAGFLTAAKELDGAMATLRGDPGLTGADRVNVDRATTAFMTRPGPSAGAGAATRRRVATWGTALGASRPSAGAGAPTRPRVAT